MTNPDEHLIGAEPVAWCADCGRALYPGDRMCAPECTPDGADS